MGRFEFGISLLLSLSVFQVEKSVGICVFVCSNVCLILAVHSRLKQFILMAVSVSGSTQCKEITEN